jgi:hypothetical protein
MRRSLAALIALLVLAPPAAQASTRSKIIADCADDGVLQGHYSASELRDARKHLSGDVLEYSDCVDVLRRAELPSGGGTGTSTTPGVSGSGIPPSGGAAAPSAPLTPQTPEDTAALTQAHDAPDHPVSVAGQDLLAGAAPLREGYRANGLPSALVIALILLGLAGLALSIPPVRRRLPRLGFPPLRRS